MATYPVLSGLVHVTGPLGVGKTMFAASACPPDRTLVLDFEQSGIGYSKQYTFTYRNLVPEYMVKRGGTWDNLGFYTYVQEVISEIPSGKFDVVTIDNPRPLEEGIEAYVRKNFSKYGLSPRQAEGALIWGPIHAEFKRVFHAITSKGVKLVCYVTHLQERWSPNGQPLGVYKPRGMQVLGELSSLTLWLRFSPSSKVPYGLVLKERLGLMLWVKALIDYPPGMQVRISGAMRRSKQTELPATVLIPRLPRKLPQATWGTIAHYLEHPTDWDHPTPDEVPSESDWHVLNGTLPQEAVDTLRLAVLEAEKEKVLAGQVPAKPPEEVPTSIGELLARAMQEPHRLTLPEVLNVLQVQNIGEIKDISVAWSKLRQVKEVEE